MATYRVYLTTQADTVITVEAEDMDHAIELAGGRDMPTLCAQCSGWSGEQNLELGDWDAYSVTDEATGVETIVKAGA